MTSGRRNEEEMMKIEREAAIPLETQGDGDGDGDVSLEGEESHMHKGFGLFQATAVNVINMFGTGPLITLPLMVVTMHGPRSFFGYALATLLTICDGMVWAELGTLFPQAGGTYEYLLEAFGRHRWGKFFSFLFIWQFLLSAPLEIASGYVGVGQYISYLWHTDPNAPAILVAVAAGVVGLINIAILYRDLTDINKIGTVLFGILIFVVCFVSITGFAKFDIDTFHTPPVQPHLPIQNSNWHQFLELANATRVAVYDFSGYYEICYMGSEVANPGYVIPKAVVGSVIIVVCLFLMVEISVIGVVPWTEIRDNTIPAQYPIAYFLEVAFPAAINWLPYVFVILLVLTVYGSSFALLLGYSRIPYAAAKDGNFFRIFGRLHKQGFPHISLLIMGLLSVACCFFRLETLVSALITARILVQYIAQIVGLSILRRRTDLTYTYKVWLYPLPNLIATVIWLFLFFSATTEVIVGTLIAIAVGVVLFLTWSFYSKNWPFCPKSSRAEEDGINFNDISLDY